MNRILDMTAVCRTGLLLLLGLNATAQIAPEKQEAFNVVRIYFADVWELADIRARVEPWTVYRDRGFLITELDETTLLRMQSEGYAIARDAYLTQQYTQPAVANEDGAGIPGFPCYATVAETFAAAAAMVVDHPQLAEWVDAGDSWEKTQALGGSDMGVLKLTNSAIAGPKPALFIMSSMHAREYAPAGVNLDFATYLLDNYGSDADVTWILDAHEIHLMLQANPDGRQRAETGLNWRKNANSTFCSGPSQGVDLNRNFEFQWGISPTCSSTNECSFVFRGSAPASEPETDAIQEYVRSIFPDQRGPNLSDPAPVDASGIFFDLHSAGGCVLWPYGFDTTEAPNGVALTTFGRKLAWYNNYSPEKASVSFDTCGTTDDFGYGDLGIAAYTFELGTSFQQSCGSYASTVWPTNLQALLYAARAAREPYLIPAGPNSEEVAVPNNTAFGGSPITVTAWIDEDRYNNQNGTEPIQVIAGAEAHVGTPPWEAVGMPGQPLTASDGLFDETDESVTGEIDTIGLDAGQHTVYVRGRDAENNWGVVSAAFFHVIGSDAAHVVGTVRGLDTGEPVFATVSADAYQATTDAGPFTLHLPPGTYTIRISADGYLTREFPSVLVSGQTLDLDTLLFPLCAQNLDLIPVTGTWANLETPAGPVWEDSPGGYYRDDSDSKLETQPLDFRAMRGLSLRFEQRYALDTPGGDFIDIGYRQGQGPAISLRRYEHVRDWHSLEIPLQELEGKDDVRLSFRLHADGAFNEDGWSLARPTLIGAGPDCVETLLLAQWPGLADVRDFAAYYNQP